jgi:hypothetical protein
LFLCTDVIFRLLYFNFSSTGKTKTPAYFRKQGLKKSGLILLPAYTGPIQITFDIMFKSGGGSARIVHTTLA